MTTKECPAHGPYSTICETCAYEEDKKNLGIEFNKMFSELGRFKDHVAKLTEVAKCAAAVLQDELDNYAHGTVADWNEELENEIGWGKNCNAYKLARALTALGKE